MKAKKSDMTLGLEKILNSPEASPLSNPHVFRSILTQSGQNISETLKYIGKKSKTPRVSDEEKSKARLEKLETASEQKT